MTEREKWRIVAIRATPEQKRIARGMLIFALRLELEHAYARQAAALERERQEEDAR